MESKKINQLATSVSPQTSDLTIIGDPITGVSKKITLLQIANLFATTGTVSSVAVTETGDALTITGSPITSTGTINIGFAGDATQYVRGDGALADFPTSTGGGSSVSYYLNSSVSQGTIGGVAYRELSKDPISGAGTDITISANGYVASYITDANDPALLEVPGGNFNCEFYFSVNSDAHNPYVYAELYKYDGTTFTLLGSSQSVPEYLSNGTTLSPYYFAIPVAASALTITDRLAIRIYANVDTRTVTLHTENNHLCQVVTTFSKGLTSLNNLTRQVQFFGTGTSGTDFAITSSTATHTFNLPVASATNTGKLSSTDWSTFNAKQPAGNYVTLDTNQTITALKAFNTPVIFNNALNLTFGAPVTALGNNFAIYASKISNYSILSLYDADTAKYSELYFDNTTNRSYTFPNASGTIALTSNLSSYVPYTGATANVTLGLFDLYAQNVFATDTSGNWLAALSRDTATAIGALVLKSGGFTNYLQPITTVSSARTWTLPDASGTIALTSQLTGGTVTSVGLSSATSGITIGSSPITTSGTITLDIATASGSQNGLLSSTDWTTFNGKQAALNGTGFVKASGTTITYDNSTYLTTSAAASTYLPLAGGTLTGALNGTSAVFSSTVQASAYRLTGMTAGSGALYWSSDRVTLANYNASGSVAIETGGGTIALTLASNQAATFAGALSGTSATFSGTVEAPLFFANAGGSLFLQSASDAISIRQNSTSNNLTIRFNRSGVDLWKIQTVPNGANEDFKIFNSQNSTNSLTIASTGAATFSSSVTAGGKVTATGGNFIYALEANAGTTSGQSYGLKVTGGTTSTDDAMVVYNAAASSTFFRIAGNGNVGIGTSSPANGQLEVLRTTDGSIAFLSNSFSTFTGNALTIDVSRAATAAYNLIWAQANNAAQFYVTGAGVIYAKNATVQVISSDYNLKTDIKDYDKGLNEVLSMKPRYFKYKDDLDNILVGFIAQEMDEAIKGSLVENKEGNKSYQIDWYPLLVKAIQEQQAQIEELKALINK